MKKTLLLVCSAMLLNSVVFAQFAKKPLFEEFTNASCAPCASQNPAYNALLASYGDSVLTTVKYQASFPGTDPFYESNEAETDDMQDIFGLSGVPTFWLNGSVPNSSTAGGAGNWGPGNWYDGAPGGLTAAVIDSFLAQESQIGMELTHSLSEDLSMININVKILVDPNNDVNAENWVLRLAFTEEATEFEEAPGTNGETEFSYIMRKMLPDYSGTKLPSLLTAGDTIEFNFDFEIPGHTYNYDQISVVAIVQDDGSREVHQSGYSARQDLVGEFADLNMESSTLPPSGLCEYEITPGVVVENVSDIEVTEIIAAYSLNGGDYVETTWTGTLSPGSADAILFDVTVLDGGLNSLDYQLVSVNGTKDIHAINNLLDTESYGTVSQDVLPDFIFDYEDEPLYDYPTSALIQSPISSNFLVMDMAGLGGTGDLGGYAESPTSIWVNYWQWNPASVDPVGSMTVINPVDLSDEGAAVFSFDHAYCQYQTFVDKLEVRVSTDCGVTWSTVWSDEGASMATSPSSTSFWVPTTADHWRTNEVDLSEFIGNSSVLIQLQATSAWGNNLFIDNMNFNNEPVGVFIPEELKAEAVITPNPASEKVSIDLTMENSEMVEVTLYDLAGKKVDVISSRQSMSAGKHNISYDNPGFAGLYLVKIKGESGEFNKKVLFVK